MAKQAQIDAVRPVLTAIDKDVAAVEGVLDAIVSGADKATDVLETGLETVADVVPEVLDKSVHVAADVTRRSVRAFRNPRNVALAIILASAAAGAGLGVAGYYFMKKRMEKEFEEKFERQIDEMREFYIRQNKAGRFATPRTAAETLLVKDAVEALDKYQGERIEGTTTAIIEEADEVPVEPTGKRYDKVVTNGDAAAAIRDKVVTIEETPNRNIFVDGKELVDDDWDLEAEEANRNPERPYVISFEEYMENSFEHPQTELTYYSGDDVLADEDGMINEVESLVGINNLTRFGDGSKDPNVVYIRNERAEVDYEVTRSQGEFSKEVLGLRHSNEPRLKRARWGEDE